MTEARTFDQILDSTCSALLGLHALDAEGRDFHWRLGDDAVDLTRPASHRSGGNTRGVDADTRLRDFVDQAVARTEVDYSYTQCQEYRAVATAFPYSARCMELPIPWTVFRMAHARTDRHEKMREFIEFCQHEDADRPVPARAQRRVRGNVRFTTRRMQHVLHIRVTPQMCAEDRVPEVRQALQRMDPETRAAVVAEAAASDTSVATSTFRQIATEQPAAVARSMRDTNVRASIATAARQVDAEITMDTRRLIETDPTLQRMDAQQAALDMQAWIARIRTEMSRFRDDIWPRVTRLSETHSDHVMLRGLLIELDETLAPIRHLAETGQSDLDQFLSATLRGQSDVNR